MNGKEYAHMIINAMVDDEYINNNQESLLFIHLSNLTDQEARIEFKEIWNNRQSYSA